MGSIPITRSKTSQSLYSARFCKSALPSCGIAEETHRPRVTCFPVAPREREVLHPLVKGHPNKIVAYELGVSPRIVAIHRANIMDKQQARNLSDILRQQLAGILSRSHGLPGRLLPLFDALAVYFHTVPACVGFSISATGFKIWVFPRGPFTQAGIQARHSCVFSPPCAGRPGHREKPPGWRPQKQQSCR